MALSDYLNLVPSAADKASEDFLRQAGTYTTNRQVLKLLGEEDTQKKADEGLLTGLFRVIGVPGNIIRAGVAEAIGRPTPELAATSGLDQFRKILRGEIRVGAGDIPGLAVSPVDKITTKALKLGAALAGDIATDPISYVTAPASISRKAAATLLLNNRSAIMRDILSISPERGGKRVAELFEKSPLKVAADIQIKNKLPVNVGERTPAELIQDANIRKSVTEDAVGNYLAEGLEKGGRRELIRRLKDLTGSDSAALDLFKKLPEEVRGGIVLSNILGKPLKRQDGSYIRLTEGTGEKLGKGADLINRARLRALVTASPVTRMFGGLTGDTLAEVRKHLYRNEDELPGRDRFIDAVKVKQELAASGVLYNKLATSALAKINIVVNRANKFGDKDYDIVDNVRRVKGKTAEREKYEAAFNEYFFNPLIAKQPIDEIENAAKNSAEELHKLIKDAETSAIENGIDLSAGSSIKGYTPLMMTKDSARVLSAVDRNPLGSTEWSTFYGRDSFLRIMEDAAEAARLGYIDENNPGIVYMNARQVNERMKELNDPRRFEEDPIKIVNDYVNMINYKISNAKLINNVRNSGTLIQDVPYVRTLLNEKNALTFALAVQNILPQVRAEAEERLIQIAKELDEALKFDEIADIQKSIQEKRIQVKSEFDAATADVVNAEIEYKKQSALVKQFDVRVPALARKLRELRQDFRNADKSVTAAQKLVNRTLDDYASTGADINIEIGAYKKDKRFYNRLINNAATPEEQSMAMELKTLADENIEEAEARLDALYDETVLARAEKDAALDFRRKLPAQIARDLSDTITQYTDAIIAKSDATLALSVARGIRRTAKREFDKIPETVEFEKVTTIDTMFKDYLDRRVEFLTVVNNKDNTIKALKKEGRSKAEIQAYRDSVKDIEDAARTAMKNSEDFIKERLSTNVNLYKDVAREYVTELFSSVNRLSYEQFEVLQALKSEKVMLDYIDTVKVGARESEVVMSAVQDLYESYKDIIDVVGTKDFSQLAGKQAAILIEARKQSFGDRLIREELEASPMAKDISLRTSPASAKNVNDAAYQILNVNSSTRDLYATKGIHKLFEDIYRAEKDPTEFERVTKDFLDPLLGLWKIAVTIGRGPGYVATNTSGGLFMNYLGNVSGKNHNLSFKLLRQVWKNFNDIQKSFPERATAQNLLEAELKTKEELSKVKIGNSDLYEVLIEFFARGGFNDTETQFTIGLVSEAGATIKEEAFKLTGAVQRTFTDVPRSETERKYRETINFLLTNRVQRALNVMAQSSEMYLRLAAFIDGFEKYGNFESAISNVHILHFNYQDLSEAEQWVRRFIPFYTWSRNNIPAILRASVMQPGKIQRALYANEEFQNTFGAEGDESWYNQVIPEYMDVANGFASSFKFGNNNIGFYLRLPFEDVNKLFKIESGVILPRGRELVNMLGPFTTPIEVAAGLDLATGAKFREQGVTVPEYYNIFKFLPGANIYRDKEGNLRAASGFAKTIQDLFPQLSVAERAVSGAAALPALAGADIPKWLVGAEQQKRSLSDLLNVTGIAPAFGVSAITLTPEALTGELRRRGERQTATIARLATEKGIDTDWLRAQLRAGKTPEEVAVLIAAGQGLIGKEEEKSTMKEESRKRYIENLQNL